MTIFGNLMFVNPWVLAGLLALPVIWLLLRVTPPAPQRILFPPTRFLADLQPDEQTPSKTPWWILLLRLITAALILTALAQPILNPGETLPGNGPVRITIDNGWSAAQNWEAKIMKARSLMERAARENREILILTTAPEPGKAEPFASSPLTGAQAEAILGGLSPHPWPADYKAATQLARETQGNRDSITSYFLSSGIRESETDDFIRRLQNQGNLEIVTPDDHELPLLLRPQQKAGTDFQVQIDYPGTIRQGTPVRVQAIAGDGRVLDVQERTIEKPGTPLNVQIDLPDNLRHLIAQVRIAGRNGAGAVLLLDEQYTKRAIGIVAPAGQEESAPLVEAGFYLTRALEPYANVHTGTVGSLLSRSPSVLILPDIAGLPPDELNQLENWVKEGGLLLRFAGPNMTQGENFLIPVPLRKGGRALDGVLTWDEPLAMAPFPKNSPYYGLPLPEEGITVKRQILPEAVAGIEDMTWAALSDGTPLVTAAPLEQGLLVMIHTTATPHWSDLPLSGLFVQILRRTIALSGRSFSPADTSGTLQPVLILDGMGRLEQPSASVRPIAGDMFDKAQPSSTNPPGIYGRAGYQKALNLGDRIPPLKPLGALPAGVRKSGYEKAQETPLMPPLLLAALCLFMMDWLIMIFLQTGVFSLFARRTAPAAIALAVLVMPMAKASAYTMDDMIKYAGAFHLAYIKSGNSQVDYTAFAGLQNLADVLNLRTSVEPEGVVAVDLEKDELAFFPLIYWPVTPNQTSLSPEALHRLQHYLDHGGTILIDTRNRSTGTQGTSEQLRSLLAGLNVPPLVPMPKDHVLTKSFYLLRDLPGQNEGGTVWVEEQSASGRDGVSSIIIGSNDWAAAWARADTANNFSSLYGSPRKEEMALRTGINFVMYALTGNYKADQVHLPHILERLGQ